MNNLNLPASQLISTGSMFRKKTKFKIARTGFSFPEAVVWRCFVKKIFKKNSYNSQENSCASFLVKL